MLRPVTRSRRDKLLLTGLVHNSTKRRSSSLPPRHSNVQLELKSLTISSTSSPSSSSTSSLSNQSPASSVNDPSADEDNNMDEQQLNDQQPPPPPPPTAPPTTSAFFTIDPSLSPKIFTGHEDDCEEWLLYFNRFSTFRNMDGPAKCGYFSILLRSTAADWFETLPDATKINFGQLETAFKNRFTKLDLTRWKNADKLLSRIQKADESVDQFVTDFIKLARAVPVNDDQLIRYAIIRGLKPQIRLHVTQQENMDTLDKVLRAARVAELAQPSSTTANTDAMIQEILTAVKSTNQQSDQNAAELQRLSSRLDKLTVNSAADRRSSDRRSPSATPPPSRRVHFQDSPQRPMMQQWQQGRQQQQQQRQQRQQRQPCSRCLLFHSFGQCRAYNAFCKLCGLKGHYARTHATDYSDSSSVNMNSQ